MTQTKRAMQVSDLINMRLYTQGLDHPAFSNPAEVVRFFGAVQAQDYPAALWAIGLRLPGMTCADIERAIAEKRITRQYPMRGTVHFVTAEDIRWIQALIGPRSRGLINNAARNNGLNLDEAAFLKANDVLAKALQGGRQMTRKELYAALEQAGLASKGLSPLLLLQRAIVDGVLCYATMRGKQHTLALQDEWLPYFPVLERDAALAELARRYFASHGPATDRDFAWWSSLTLTEARSALAMVRDELSSAEVEGQTYWFSPAVPTDLSLDPSVLLLPNYDEYTVAYKDRSAVIEPQYMEISFHALSPTLLVDGRVVGTWKRVINKDTIAVTLSPFKPAALDMDKLNQVLKRFGEFWGNEVILG